MKNLLIPKMLFAYLVVICFSSTGFSQNSDSQHTISSSDKLPLKADPKYWPKSNGIPFQKSSRLYVKAAEKSLRKENYLYAIGYAAMGFESAKKKRQVKKLTSILTQDNYSHAYEKVLKFEETRLEEIESYKTSLSPYHTNYLIWNYKQIDLINGLIESLSNKSVSIQTKAIDHSRVEELETKLKSYRQLAAEVYYSEADRLYAQAKNKDEWKLVSAYYDISNWYVKGYKNAVEMIEKTKENAITTLSVLPATSNVGSSFHGSQSLDDVVRSEINKKIVGLPYLQLLSETSTDYSLKLAVNDISFKTYDKEPTTSEYKKKVESGKNSKGEPTYKEITANVTYYERHAYTEAKIHYELIDRSNNGIIHSGDVLGQHSWKTEWAKVVGNKDALSKKKKKRLPQPSPEQMPNRKEMNYNAVMNSRGNVVSGIEKRFLAPKGKGLR